MFITRARARSFYLVWVNLLNIIRDKHSLVYKIVLYLFSIFIISFLLPSKYHYSLNSIKGLRIWPYKTLVAEKEFYIKKPEAKLKREQAEIMLNSPVYFKENTSEKDAGLMELEELIEQTPASSVYKKIRLLFDTIYTRGVIEKVGRKEERNNIRLHRCRNGYL